MTQMLCGLSFQGLIEPAPYLIQGESSVSKIMVPCLEQGQRLYASRSLKILDAGRE